MNFSQNRKDNKSIDYADERLNDPRVSLLQEALPTRTDAVKKLPEFRLDGHFYVVLALGQVAR